MKLKNLLAISMSAVLAMTALTACGSKDDSSEAASESASSSKKTAKVIEIDRSMLSVLIRISLSS